jgi:hypothetical protein
MRPIDLPPAVKIVWDTLTQEQKNIITIFYENYCQLNDTHGFPSFVEAMFIDEVDAATYTTMEQYAVWRGLSREQKEAVICAYRLMKITNDPQLMHDYDEEEVYNMDMPYDVYVLYRLFTLTGSKPTFKFLTNNL